MKIRKIKKLLKKGDFDIDKLPLKVVSFPKYNIQKYFLSQKRLVSLCDNPWIVIFDRNDFIEYIQLDSEAIFSHFSFPRQIFYLHRTIFQFCLDKEWDEELQDYVPYLGGGCLSGSDFTQERVRIPTEKELIRLKQLFNL